jgi:hypothetical protein
MRVVEEMWVESLCRNSDKEIGDYYGNYQLGEVGGRDQEDRRCVGGAGVSGGAHIDGSYLTR